MKDRNEALKWFTLGAEAIKAGVKLQIDSEEREPVEKFFDRWYLSEFVEMGDAVIFRRAANLISKGEVFRRTEDGFEVELIDVNELEGTYLKISGRDIIEIS
jgi:hypothetical protein